MAVPPQEVQFALWLLLSFLMWCERLDVRVIVACMNARAPNVLLYVLLFWEPEGQRDSVSGGWKEGNLCNSLPRPSLYPRAT